MGRTKAAVPANATTVAFVIVRLKERTSATESASCNNMEKQNQPAVVNNRIQFARESPSPHGNFSLIRVLSGHSPRLMSNGVLPVDLTKLSSSMIFQLLRENKRSKVLTDDSSLRFVV